VHSAIRQLRYGAQIHAVELLDDVLELMGDQLDAMSRRLN